MCVSDVNYRGDLRFNIRLPPCSHPVIPRRVFLDHIATVECLIDAFFVFVNAVERWFLCTVQGVSIKHVLDLSLNCKCKPCGTVGLT